MAYLRGNCAVKVREDDERRVSVREGLRYTVQVRSRQHKVVFLSIVSCTLDSWSLRGLAFDALIDRSEAMHSMYMHAGGTHEVSVGTTVADMSMRRLRRSSGEIQSLGVLSFLEQLLSL